MTIQQVQHRGRISIIKIQNFTIQRRQSIIKIIYGSLLVLVGLVMATINPLQRFTEWFMDIQEGSFVFRMWEDPPYKLRTEVWVFNYTNLPAYMSGKDKLLRVQEVGPFTFLERRRNLNSTIDQSRGILRFKPNVSMSFLREESVSDLHDVHVTVPNIAMIALSTLAADNLNYMANVGAYWSMVALGSKLFMNMTIHEFLWGYEEPIVTLANRLLPGWISFGKLGILDRLYDSTTDWAEMEVRDRKSKFSIQTWDDSAGLIERGFTDLNSSTNCNRIQGTFEGLLLPPDVQKDSVIPIFRKQACRTYPFTFERESSENIGFNYYRFKMERSAFSQNSSFACPCSGKCLPEGFVDISSCYFGFPIALSKPHFMDADPDQIRQFQGLKPDRERHTSLIDVEPTMGVPVAIYSHIQANSVVRTNPGNPMTHKLKDKVMPLVWVSMYCKTPSSGVLMIMRLRFIIGPPAVIIIAVLLLVFGMVLGAQGFYRVWKPKYKLMTMDPPPKRKKSSVAFNISDNIGYNDDYDCMAKEAVSLLTIKEETSLPDLLFCDN